MRQNKMLLEYVSCDLCGCEEYTERYRKPDNWLKLHQYSFPVVECVNCGLVYVNPRPTFNEIGRFYPQGYHDGRDSDDHHDRYSLQYSYLEKFKFSRILDVGCAKGDWLKYVKMRNSDAQLFGVDAFSASVHEGITFYQGILPEADLPSDYFDVVTSWAVFEHVHTPKDYFNVVAKVLRKGGEFVFLVTNSESLYGRRAFREDIPRHLYHFNKSSLENYACEAGLVLKKIVYDDDLFDGRGWGTFSYTLGRLFGFSWDKAMRNRAGLTTKAAMFLGRYLDRLIFFSHWERRLRRSGIIVVIMEKAENHE